MVTLEQIRQLDARVHRAVELIGKLKEENTTLKNRLSEYQDRIEELEVLISNFKEDQSEIEQGIANVLTQLAAIDEAGKTGGHAKASARTASAHQAEPAQPQELEEEEQGEPDKPEAELDIF